MQPELALNSRPLCSNFVNARTIGVHYHTWKEVGALKNVHFRL